MTSSESRRHDLYNGLTEVLGVERADVLMTYLPSTESTELATKADIRVLESRIDKVEANLTVRIDSVGTRVDALATRIDALATRIDRIVLAVVAALVVIIARTFF